MATSAATLVQRSRRFLGDWPEQDVTTASVTSGAASLAVADATIYQPGWLVELDSEAFTVTTNVGTTLGVRRAQRGSVAASHVTASTILVRPRFLSVDYLDALNAGINASFPLLYQPVIDESLTVTTTDYEYTVPNLNSVPIPYLSRLSLKATGETRWDDVRNWDVVRGTTPKIRFRNLLDAGTLRVHGFGPLPPLASLSASLDALFPVNAEDALITYAAQWLLASGEARRVREDTGLRSERENANRTGSSMNTSNALLQRFTIRLMASAMPPMPRHIKPVY